jgi:hypothetical protein
VTVVVSMLRFLCVLLFSDVAYLSATGQPHDQLPEPSTPRPDTSRIHFVLPDKDHHWFRSQLIRLKPNMTFSNVKLFFDMQPIGAGRRIADIEKVDMFMWKDWSALNAAVQSQRLDYHAVIPPTYIKNSKKILDLFNNKVKWLQFMRNAGLSAHVPTVYSDTCDIYPCILKNSKVHWGKGVHVVHNESHLQRVIAETV